jgi:CheY-like chemotaxis protein
VYATYYASHARPAGPVAQAVLVVDDNSDHLELLGAFFKACGAHVLFARNADAALAYLKHAVIHLVVSDLSMARQDGISLIRAIREPEGRQCTVPAIAVTGFYENYVRAREHGFDAFLQKPVSPDALAKTIRDLFEAR